MKIFRRTRIRIETRERSMFRISSSSDRHCALCGTETEHLTIAQFSARTSFSERNIFRLTETGELHGLDCDDGRFLICAGKSC